MVKCDVAALKFFVANQQLAESAEPPVVHFDHPTPRLLCRVAPLGGGFLAAIDDMRDVAIRFDDLQCVTASIAGVGTQTLAAAGARRFTLGHDGLQHLIELGDAMLIGPSHDERQQDDTAVH